jgi:hypothetical protein
MLWLIFAHCIGDWVLQNYFMHKNITKYFEVLVVHCVIYTGTISICLRYLDKLSLFSILFIFIGHLLVDVFTCKKLIKKFRSILYIDQFLHIIQLIIIY